MKLRRIILASAAILTLANCAEDVERLAKPYLDRAQESYANKQYALAKLQIDSIKQLYPKAFNTRAEAQALLLDVELAEACTSKLYTDSLLATTQVRTAELTKGLYLDKDINYQDIGTYYDSRHRIEQNIGKSYLRPQTDEQGRFAMVAFLHGRTLAAHSLRLSAPDGSFVEVRATSEPYVMTNAAGRTERADFVPDTCSHVVNFAALHTNEALQVTLMGKNGKQAIPFGKADAKALVQVGELAKLLMAIEELKHQQSEAERRILFFEQRKEASGNSTAAEQ